jgi:hypothetical protein
VTSTLDKAGIVAEISSAMAHLREDEAGVLGRGRVRSEEFDAMSPPGLAVSEGRGPHFESQCETDVV